MKTGFFKTILMTTLLVFFGLSVYAQTAVPPPAPNCDQVLSTTKASMQKRADANCQSITQCVPCTDKKLGHLLYVTMVVNPTPGKCATPTAKSTGSTTAAESGEVAKTNTLERGPAVKTARATEVRPSAPDFEILQERCEDGTGINVDVYIPGNVTACSTGQYAYLWEVDGGKGGHAATLPCACGKVAQLTVTEIKTGLSQTKRIELLPCVKK